MILLTRKFLTPLFFAAILTGCASNPVVELEPFDTSISTEGDFNESWSKMVAFLSTNDISIGTIEKDSGLVTLSGDSLSVPILRKYCDATAPFLWVLQNGTARGSVLMVNDDGFVTTTVNLKLNGTSMYTDWNTGRTNYQTKPCNSTGVFETALLNSVR